MSWIYLVVAGLFEVLWSTTLSLSNGLTNIYWSIITVLGMILSIVFLSLALKNLQIGIAYPVWTGIGAVGSIIAGMLIFKDKISSPTWFFIFLLIVGIIGIKITSKS